MPSMFKGGSVLFQNGERYYSPNSVVGTLLRLEPLHTDFSNPGKDRVRYRDLVNPGPWDAQFAWTPFIPVTPSQWFDRHTYLGRVLSKYPPLEHYTDGTGETKGWAVALGNDWTRLETDLYKAAVVLSGHCHIPCSLPYTPSAIGYAAMYADKRALVSRLQEARDWFFVWFGVLSYLVACARVNPNPDIPPREDEQWLGVLHSRGVSPSFVDALGYSLIAERDGGVVQRAGVVIDLLDDSRGRPQPKWFVDMTIPVWYRRGSAEEKKSSIDSWRPPTHLIRQEVLSTHPDPPSERSTVPHSTTSSQKEPEWVAFLESREAAHEQMLKAESRKARQAREARMREPVTASVKVFEWFPPEREGMLYERIPVLAKPGSTLLPAMAHLRGGTTPSSTSGIAAWNGVVMITKTGTTKMLDEVNETLAHFYGFSHPIPGGEPPSNSDAPTERDKVFLLRVVGPELSTPGEQPYFSTGHYLAAQAFIKSLCDRQTPMPGSWDLRDECVHPVRHTSRFRHIRVIELSAEDKEYLTDEVSRYYVFDDAGLPWKVGVTSAAGALLVCRLPPSHTAYDIAVFLSSYGIPFRTFYPPIPLWKSMSHKKLLGLQQIPTRPFGHKFTKEDYDSYVNVRTLVLGLPHMQAALKRGGIIWRLAVGTLGTAQVASSPTSWGSSHSVTVSGANFMDDVLTTTEMDLICGAYECVSEDGKQRALKSWWPLARYYEKHECGENYGRWNHRREVWYSKRLKAIEVGDISQNPLTYTEWKSKQHGPAVVRNLYAHVERVSSQLLESHLRQNV